MRCTPGAARGSRRRTAGIRRRCDEAAMTKPSWSEFLAYWLRHGWINFGGPAGQIALMQHDLVDNRRWIDQTAFLRGLNFATLLPGPEAQQLATYIGWGLFCM